MCFYFFHGLASIIDLPALGVIGINSIASVSVINGTFTEIFELDKSTPSIATWFKLQAPCHDHKRRASLSTTSLPFLLSRYRASVHVFRSVRVGQPESAQDGFRDESTKRKAATILPMRVSRTECHCRFESRPANRIREISIQIDSVSARKAGGEELGMQ